MRKVVFFLFFLLFFVQAAAQHEIHGFVMDAQTSTPVAHALIFSVRTKKLLTQTNEQGLFTLSKLPQSSLQVKRLGYRPQVFIFRANDTLRLQTNSSALQEVVVTAQEGKGLTAQSTIQRSAMEHLQPSSFTDILSLLPGGRTLTPQLNTPNTIHLREAASPGTQYQTSALGTAFMLDGAPIGRNANMQFLNGASDPETTSRTFNNSGVDMRSLSTDDIDRVDIVRGIPSVEYGDLTSGLVKIQRKNGGNDWRARLKADMKSQLFYLSKGFDHHRGLTFNLSADYLNAKADPRNILENYQRFTLSARTQHMKVTPYFRSVFSASIDYGGSFDNDKKDPELNNGMPDRYRSSYQRMAGKASWEISPTTWNFLEKVNALISFNYEKDLIEREKFIQLTRDMPAPTSQQSGVNDATILPYRYTALHKADGRPLYAYTKITTKWHVPHFMTANHLLVGADWDFAKNRGKGQVFDPSRPIYPYSVTRLRALKSIPALQTLSGFAEWQLQQKTPIGRLRLTAGLRLQKMLHLRQHPSLSRTPYLDPRLNIGWTFTEIGHSPLNITLNAGIGQHTKTPTMDQLYPEPLYVDLIQLNFYHPQSAYRRINLRTYQVDANNPDLKAARNLKKEIGMDIQYREHRLSVTLFHEKMSNGFRTSLFFRPFNYRAYDARGIDATRLTAPPDLNSLPYQEKQELMGISKTTNGSETVKQGIEFTYSSPRFPILLTRLTITGAYFKTIYRNAQAQQVRPTVNIGQATYPYVGIYQDNDGITREMVNTNFTFDTYIPRLKLGFSLSAQCLWFTSSQRLSLSLYPQSYLTPDGQEHSYTEADRKDKYLQWMKRDYNASLFEKAKIPFSVNFNLKVTKRLLQDKLNIALFCDRIWDYTPSYKSHDFVIRRYVEPYFGVEINCKL